MTATKIGVYYSLATGRWTHIKIPDDDWELRNPNNIQPGEGLIVLPFAAYKFFTHDALQLYADANTPVNQAELSGVKARAFVGMLSAGG